MSKWSMNKIGEFSLFLNFIEGNVEKKYLLKFRNVRRHSISLISQRLTKESALPTATYLHKAANFKLIHFGYTSYFKYYFACIINTFSNHLFIFSTTILSHIHHITKSATIYYSK